MLRNAAQAHKQVPAHQPLHDVSVQPLQYHLLRMQREAVKQASAVDDVLKGSFAADQCQREGAVGTQYG
jgi:hypothetical protein